MPHKSSVPMVWRMEASRYKLVSSKCNECSLVHFPARDVCPNCHKNTEKIGVSGKGEIFSITTIHTAPVGFENRTPYVIAIVKLDEGPMISGEVVGDVSKVEIGSKVKAVFRKLYEDGEAGLIHYGFKFEAVK